jgi:hypothetical protein
MSSGVSINSKGGDCCTYVIDVKLGNVIDFKLMGSQAKVEGLILLS